MTQHPSPYGDEPTRTLPTTTPATERLDSVEDTGSGERPPVRIAHLVFGVLFLGIAGLWSLSAGGIVALDANLSYLVPGTLVVAGLVGLVAMIGGHRGTRRL